MPPACISCKKLKIKCDRAVPKCEYCLHTNKICEYPAKSQQILNINNTQKLFNVTELECKLMTFYVRNSTMFFSTKPDSPQESVWRYKVPMMWNSSPVIRNCIYGVSAVFHWIYYDSQNLKALELGGTSLMAVTSHYFDKCAQNMFEMFQGKARNSEESIILLHLMFVCLCVNPMRPIPLYSLKGETDIVSVVMQFKQKVSVNFFDIVMSEMSPLLYLEEYTQPSDALHYKFLTTLKLKLKQDESMDQVEKIVLLKAVEDFESCVHRALIHNYPLPLFRTLFRLGLDFYQLLKSGKNIVAHKILYYCSAFSSLLHFDILQDANIWMDYINFYKNLERFENDYFWDEDDQCLYYLLVSSHPCMSLEEIFII